VVTRFPITVEDKSSEILHMLRLRPTVRFFDVIGSLTRMHIVVTFLALLELDKNHLILVQQDEVFDDIVIVMRKPTAEGDASIPASAPDGDGPSGADNAPSQSHMTE
jgi:chromatin segregation and condensation protein Rec8/ScpA/Scc1 (kleisin family)